MNLKSHFRSKRDSFRMLHTDCNVVEMMQHQLISWLPEIPREYVIVCIGTDRSTGDALGPLTGTYLSESKPKHMFVYGTLNEPVHATNLEYYVQKIKDNHRNPFVIAVDACLGKTESVGHIISNKGAVKPGAALNKSLPAVGDIHLTGVVNISGFMEYSVLQNTRLSIVVEMAKKIAAILEAVDKQLTYERLSHTVVSSRLKNQSS